MEDFKSQVESRLDDLFHEDEESIDSMDRFGGVGDHPLKGLKAILLSVEWEITESSMESLINELRTLEDFYKDDKLILAFLRLLTSIARYINVRRGKAHPNATSLLTSVYNGLERVSLSQGMSRKEKERILLREVDKFKKLKEEVIRRKKEQEEGEEAKQSPSVALEEAIGRPAEESAKPDLTSMTTQELVLYALDEIKTVLREEFGALLAEMKVWRESR
jgi:hypothetical protein